ncbi:DUF2975 domain-containing protein [Acholeplasma granularum]|uniref:DUF2975 domain-containing protein n=1 Tax=Acholeplasma granularum TaxID=264635 RepID=UPI0004AFE5F7|nr:DUF2975 domain-containing protein [Acholeplasma granularum]
MIIFQILLTVLSIAILGFAIYMLYIIRRENMSLIIKYLDKVIWVLFSLIALIFLALIIMSFFSLSNTPVVLVNILKYLFETVIFFLIFNETRFLLSQFKKEIIFDKSNAFSISKIGKGFITLTSIEIITGLLFGVASFIGSTNKNYTLSFDITTFIYISIGFILYLLSIIYAKAVDIYEENQLTI